MFSIRNPQSALRNCCRALCAAALALATSSLLAASAPEILDCKVGFGGTYKVGVWTPVRVTLRGGDEPVAVRVAVVAPDSDRVSVAVSSRADRPVLLEPGREDSVWLHTRIGQIDAELSVEVYADGERIARRGFVPNFEPGPGQIAYGQAASLQVFVELSAGDVGLRSAFIRSQETEATLSTVVATVSRPTELPVEWYDYEGADTVVLATSEIAYWRDITPEDPRIAALKKWVELGGKLVVLGGANGAEVFGSGGPLAELIPGRFDTVTTLTDMLPLEQYSGSSEPVSPRDGVELSAVRLVDLTGQVDAYFGATAEELPLVVRGVRGLGELVFVAVDLDKPPLRSWKGQADFVRKLVRFDPAPVDTDQSQNYAMMSRGYDDLAGGLVKRLGESFADVTPPPFIVVVGLVLLYLLLIGPGDYFFVKRVLKRMEATWITFPLIVIATSVAAYWLAHYLKGDQLRINQLEIVDIDAASGTCRGVMWTELFSPRAERYNLTVQPKLPDGTPLDAGAADAEQTLVAWMGLPGTGLSGMQGSGGQGGGWFSSRYEFSPRLTEIGGLPVQVWSTKSLTARWDGRAQTGIEAELMPTDDLVVGRITNTWDTTFDDCRLLYGTWAWRLGELAPNQSVEIDDRLAPRKLRTLLRDNFELRDENMEAWERAAQIEQVSPQGLAEFMMFAHALGGPKYTQLVNNYQGFVDLSHLLDDGRAILLCQTSEHRSEFLRDGKSMHREGNRHWTMYRFVLEVGDAGEP
ncbi:MAG: hypothetical protein WD851_25210 [Pirellulales bacterium]